jgi:hypothetical protein
MPTASVAPFVLAIGFCLIFLGVVANMLFFLVGVVWFAAGAIGWIRIGLAEARQAGAHAEPEADGAAAD